jgi:hypothetical protein
MVFVCAFEKGRLPFAYVISRDAEEQQVFQPKLFRIPVVIESRRSGFHELFVK